LIRSQRTRVVAALGTAQTLAWASSYYLPAVLADPMARDLGVARPFVFLAFSLALVVSAAIGPWAGRSIDRHGGRPVLMVTNGLFACGLLALAFAQGPASLLVAWALLGLAMGSGLYEAAFATLVRLYGNDSRNAITGITLIAGFASTVGWPLSAWMEVRFGWRGACVGWAALHLLVGLPLNAWVRMPDKGPPLAKPPASPVAHPSAGPSASSVAHPAEQAAQALAQPATIPARRASILLAFVFAATWFTSTAMAAHLPVLLQAAGATLTVAVAVGALIGPAQVAGRLLEFGLLRRVHPLLSARLATLAHPAGVLALLLAGPAMAPVFAVLHGAGNGILTIAKGTLPLALFGPQGYGERQGWLMVPARVAQAAAPVVFGLALEAWGARALWLSAGLGLGAFAALIALRESAARPADAFRPPAPTTGPGR
jgi:MFS family permease